MKIELTGLQQIRISDEAPEERLKGGWIEADVSYCAICRTDAKLWNEGQRDLVLPRVLGHEFVINHNHKSYTVWPGVVCGSCKYCKSGDENLCENIQIIGFNLDGGFATKVQVPKSSLIQLPPDLPEYLGCFAEPAGCIVNGFKKLELCRDERILIIGAGTIGLLSSLIAQSLGANPIVLEKSESKILMAAQFSSGTGIPVLKETNESKFDCVLNACADPIALMSGITRLAKSGRIVHFSGLNKNEHLETNLLNLIHYKELKLSGSYGLTLSDMKEGIQYLTKIQEYLHYLIEDVIFPYEFESKLPSVINSEAYKYIVHFSLNKNSSLPETVTKDEIRTTHKKTVLPPQLVFPVKQPDPLFKAKAQTKIDHKTKPLGSLGRLEQLSVQMSMIQHNLNPEINRKSLIVFAADHGIAEEGVSAFPQEVTAQMVKNFLDNGAAINVLCKQHHIDLSIVDMGVKKLKNKSKKLVSKRISSGTKNFALQPAMTSNQAIECLTAGAQAFEQLYNEKPIQIIGLGEMGIANTTSATAIICTLTGKSVEECSGRGTGVDDQGLEHKIKVIKKALNLHQISPKDPVDVLAKVGGFEIGAIAGAVLAAASKGCAVVLDGLISTAAGLIAYSINPDIQPYLIAGHQSVEKGHIYALKQMQLQPVLDLGMRLGEGSGAALTINLVETACHIMCEMASFDEAGVSNKEKKLSE